jgi:hypothetical protein
MTFAQLTYRESLRDIEACLRAHKYQLYHMCIRGGISRNTLANANKVRDWRINADFSQELMKIARDLYMKEAFAVDLPIPSMPSTRLQSTFVYHYSLGPLFVGRRQQSNCIPFWTYAVTSRHFNIFLMANSTMSMPSIS